MIATITTTILNALEHEKKGNPKDKYYTVSFLDEEDNSYTVYTSKEIYDKVKESKVKRFDTVSFSLRFFKQKDREGYSFQVTDYEKIPFKGGEK